MWRYASSSEGDSGIYVAATVFVDILGLNIVCDLLSQFFWTSICLLPFFIYNFWLIFLIENLWLNSISEIATIRVTWAIIHLLSLLLVLVLSRLLDSLFLLEESSIIFNFWFNCGFNANQILWYLLSSLTFLSSLLISMLSRWRSRSIIMVSWTLERLRILIWISRLWSTSWPLSFFLWSWGNGDGDATSSVLCHAASTSWLSLLIFLVLIRLFTFYLTLISHSILLSFNLLLDKHIVMLLSGHLDWKSLSISWLFSTTILSTASFWTSSLWSLLLLLNLMSLLKMRLFILSCKVSIARSVSVCIPVHFILVWRSRVWHRHIVLTWLLYDSYWWIFINIFSRGVCKALSMAVWIAHLCRVLMFNGTMSLEHRICLHRGCKIWIWTDHWSSILSVELLWDYSSDAAVLRVTRVEVALIDAWVLKISIFSRWLFISILLYMSQSSIKRVFRISLKILVNLCLSRISLELFTLGFSQVTFFFRVLLPPAGIFYLLLLEVMCLPSRLLSFSV